jgi:hypothetical protein
MIIPVKLKASAVKNKLLLIEPESADRMPSYTQLLGRNGDEGVCSEVM